MPASYFDLDEVTLCLRILAEWRDELRAALRLVQAGDPAAPDTVRGIQLRLALILKADTASGPLVDQFLVPALQDVSKVLMGGGAPSAHPAEDRLLDALSTIQYAMLRLSRFN